MKTKIDMERYGAEAFEEFSGTLPNRFPRTIGQNAMKYLKEVVDSGLTCNMVGRFEQAFAKEMGVKHCIATPGCTPSLAVLAAAFKFDSGDEIIVSPITDYGTIQGLISEHYIPVFADTEPGTVNVSAETIEPVITDRTRAILVVHKTGIICDMDPINALAEKHDLIVYEDVCQAVFGEYKGRYAGALSKAGAFSFDSEKTMGSDIGGCIVTNDDNLAEQLRFVGQSRGAVMEAHFGRKHVVLGYANRMTHCTAAICLAQLEIIRDQVAHIDRMARLLTALVAKIPGVTPLPIPDYMNVYSCWMFGMSIDPDLAEAGISGAGQGKYYLMPAACTFLDENAKKKVYPYSIPPASREYSYSADTCPNARDFLESWIRWSTFCEKYQPEHCELAAKIIRKVTERNRK